MHAAYLGSPYIWNTCKAWLGYGYGYRTLYAYFVLAQLWSLIDNISSKSVYLVNGIVICGANALSLPAVVLFMSFITVHV